MVWTQDSCHKFVIINYDHPSECSPEKDCLMWHRGKPSWLWRWLPLRMSKRQSMSPQTKNGSINLSRCTRCTVMEVGAHLSTLSLTNESDSALDRANDTTNLSNPRMMAWYTQVGVLSSFDEAIRTALCKPTKQFMKYRPQEKYLH